MIFKAALIVFLAFIGSANAQTTTNLRNELVTARAVAQPKVVSILVVREDFSGSEAALSVSSGSGTVVTPEGHVATNAHVVANGKRFKVVLNDQREFPATLVGEDAMSDLAVLKINAPGVSFPFAEFSMEQSLQAGDTVLAMGAPWGMTDSVSAGVVNHANRLLVSLFEDEADYEQAAGQDQVTARYYAWIQHDAAISPGNSGGPLVDLSGRIVGVNTRGSFFGGDMAFAIPGPIARTIVAELIKNGRVTRSDYGFNVRSLRGTRYTAGAMVSSVDRESNAEKAGLRAGDRLLSVNAVAVNLKQPEAVPVFRRQLAERAVQSSIRLKLMRGQEALELEIRSVREEDRSIKQVEISSLGISAADLSADMARSRFLEAKASVSVAGIRAGGPAASAQPPLQVGDVIESIEQRPVASAQKLLELAPPVAELDDQRTWVLAFSRRGKEMVSVITPAPKRLIPEQLPELPKSWAGWEVQPLPPALAARLKLGVEGGFRVTRVYADSPAARAGVAVGDVITATGGIAVLPSGLVETGALDQRVRNASLGAPFVVSISRAQKSRELSMTLIEQPLVIERAERTFIDRLSLVARDLTFYDRVDRSLTALQRGVIIDRVEAGGVAGLAHLRQGDLLVQVNQRKVDSVEGLSARLQALESKQAPRLSFLVMRGADTRLLFVDSPWLETQ